VLKGGDEVNLVGVHRVTRAALPHLRASRGHAVIGQEVQYEAQAGVLRHSEFIGVRDDKKPLEVKRETNSW
jgi:hypothetical protein